MIRRRPKQARRGAAAFGASADRTGWAAGGGIEYALLNNWSIKGEYLRVHLDRFTCGAACTGVAGQTVAVKFDVNMFRAGINYKFNWGGPI